MIAKLGKSVVSSLLLAMIVFGTFTGIVFPHAVSPFVEWREGMKFWFSIVAIVAGITVGGVSFVLVKVMLLRKIKLVSEQLQALSEKEGSLSKRIRFTSNDDLGDLISSFNQLLERLQTSVERIRGVSREISTHSVQTRQVSSLLADSTQAKTKLVVDTAIAIEGLEDNFQKIIENLRDLRVSSDASRKAIGGQVDLIERVNEQIDLLRQQCQSNSDGVAAISNAGNKTLESSQELTNSLTEAAASMTEMDHTIKEIDTSLKESSKISEQVPLDAGVGKEATWKTQKGMNRIRESFTASASIIQSFSEKVKEIAAITEVIDEVTDQTNLLALNAAIIAAQAGEHGRGFAVVADQIKKLADQTSSSTREIGSLIKGFEEQAYQTINSTSEIEGLISEGVTLSKQAGDSLDSILESAGVTYDHIQTLENAMKELATTSHYLAERIDTIAEGAKEISKAHQEQETSLRIVNETVSETRSVAGVLFESAREQLATSKKIQSQTENVERLIANAEGSVKKGEEESRELVVSIQEMQVLSRKEGATMGQLDEESKRLEKLYSHLEKEIQDLSPAQEH